MRLVSLVVAVVALAAALVAVPVAGAWTWPVDGPVLHPFSLGSDPYAGGQHRGVDIGAGAGNAVRAPVAGRVSFAGTLPRYGRTVTIRADGLAVTLLHLGELAVARDALVTEGQPVAVVGPSGEVEHETPYVHLGVRHAEDDKGYIDPLLFLPPRTAPVQDVPAAVVPDAHPAGEPVVPSPEPGVAVTPVEPLAPATEAPAVPPEPVVLQAEPETAPLPVPETVAATPAGSSTAHGAAPAGTAAATRTVSVPPPAVAGREAGELREPFRPGVHAHAVPAPRPPGARSPRHTLQHVRRLRRAPAAFVARPTAGASAAHADAPAATVPASTSRSHVTKGRAVLGLAVLAVLAALSAVLGFGFARPPRRQRPAPLRTPCPIGRRSAGRGPCAGRLHGRLGVPCRPTVRPRRSPRAVRRRRTLVSA